MKQHPRELGSVDEMFQNTEASYTPNMQVTNRYLTLEERIPNPHSEEKRVANNQHIHDNEVTKKALILCNRFCNVFVISLFVTLLSDSTAPVVSRDFVKDTLFSLMFCMLSMKGSILHCKVCEMVSVMFLFNFSIYKMKEIKKKI
jgi:hypothetical protein